MALFRRRTRPTVDYDELAKALSPAIARAAAQANVPGGATYNGVGPSSPFGQTGGGVLEQPLPRNGEFDSMFGPGYPLVPDPLDPVGANGRTVPRRSEYVVAWNLQLVDRQTPWTMLRWVAEDCDVVNRCIQLTQDEMAGKDWSWGFSDQVLSQIMLETGETNTARASTLAQAKYGDELTRVRQFFEAPDRDMGQSFVDWLQALLWDHLVYDGVAVYPRYNLDGTLRNLELIDAATIKLLRDNQGRIPQPPAPAYQQILYGFPRGEFQHTAGQADDEFQSDQLAYFIRRPRNTSVYGYSQVEEVLPLATTYLARQAWMRAEFTNGAIPKMLVKVAETEQWTPQQFMQYQQLFNDSLAGQTERRQQAYFMRPGMEAQFAPQIDEHYKADYDNWIISQIGARFGRPATMLGVQARAGLSGGKQMEGEMDQSDIYSGQAIQNWVIALLNTLARRYLAVGPEITATVIGGETQKNELIEAQADASDVKSGIFSRNEVRAKRGQPLMSIPEADQLSITTGTGVTFLAGSLKAQETAATGVADDTGQAPPAETAAPPVASVDTGTEMPGEVPVAKELAAFGRFASTRIAKGLAWRDFTFTAVAPHRADLLNTAGRTGDLTAVTEALAKVEDTPSKAEDTHRLMDYWSHGAGAAKLNWGVPGDFDRCRAELGKYVDPGELSGLCANLHHKATGAWPGHAPGESKKAADDPKGDARPGPGGPHEHLLIDAYLPLIHEALTGHLDPAALAEFLDSPANTWATVTKEEDDAVRPEDLPGPRPHPVDPGTVLPAVTSWLATNHPAPTRPVLTVIQGARAAGYVAGAEEAGQLLPAELTLDPAGQTVAGLIDWDTWTPGNADVAAALADDAGQGWVTLIADAEQTVKGVTDTQMYRIGMAIAQAVADGDSVDTLTTNLGSIVTDTSQAQMVATTEIARAMTVSAIDQYRSIGIDEWDLLDSPGACPICVASKDTNPHPLDDPTPPLHPRCRCAAAPHVTIPGEE